jgi:hypothetical protein
VAKDRSWLPGRHLTVNNRLQFPGRSRQVKDSVDERDVAADIHNGNLIN